jgi:hypothetical protein
MSENHGRLVLPTQVTASYARGARDPRKHGGPRAGPSPPARRLQRSGLWPSPLAAPDFALGPRCAEKGCIFPATGSGTGRCLLHELEEREPALFLSCQPTLLVLDQWKFGLPDPEADYSRARDRRRLATLREEFLEEVA